MMNAVESMGKEFLQKGWAKGGAQTGTEHAGITTLLCRGQHLR